MSISLIAILLLFLSLTISWGILILLFWVLFYEYFSTIGSIDNYNMGTLNASLVITTKPTRIAVLTNLSMGFGKYPLVRVCKMEMPKKYNICTRMVIRRDVKLNYREALLLKISK